MSCRVKQVHALPDMLLHVVFENGKAKSYDTKPLMKKHEIFIDLTRNNLFDYVRVDAGGYGIVWNDYLDLACEELWLNGIDIQQEAL
jgi:hypothetical protein